jgi:amidase
MKSLGVLRVAIWPDHGLMPVDREIADRVAMVGDVVAKKGATTSDTARPEFVNGDGFGVYRKMLMSMVGGPDDDVQHREYLGLNNQRTYYRLGWQEFFENWDVLVCPIMPTTAFPHDHSPLLARTILVNGEPHNYLNQVFWAGIATLSYLPSTVFPTGLSKDGLPIGLQVLGAEFDDATTMAFARLMAEEIGGFQAPPGYSV